MLTSYPCEGPGVPYHFQVTHLVHCGTTKAAAAFPSDVFHRYAIAENRLAISFLRSTCGNLRCTMSYPSRMVRYSGIRMDMLKASSAVCCHDEMKSQFSVFRNSLFIHERITVYAEGHYINNNRVNDGLVENVEDYIYSSAKIWKKLPIDDEPLMMNIREIKWRTR